MKRLALQMTRHFIDSDPKKYVGIDKEWLFILHELALNTKCSSDKIKLTLMKIKTNDSFSRLGDQFDVSKVQGSRIFKKTVPLLSHYLQKLVSCPEKKLIEKNLPIAFLAAFCAVSIIVDSFEMEIVKPSNSMQKGLSWSAYKNCNTEKFLIGCAPDGFLSFMSNGYLNF